MSMQHALPNSRRRTVAVLAIVIAAIAAAAMAWAILSPAGAAPNKPPAGVPGYQVVAGTSLSVAPGGHASTNVTCPTGTKPLGGGASNEADDLGESFMVLTASAPTALGDGWHVHVRNTQSVGPNITMNPYAICATA